MLFFQEIMAFYYVTVLSKTVKRTFQHQGQQPLNYVKKAKQTKAQHTKKQTLWMWEPVFTGQWLSSSGEDGTLWEVDHFVRQTKVWPLRGITEHRSHLQAEPHPTA